MPSLEQLIDGEIYCGEHFSISLVGNTWAIYRFYGETFDRSGRREEITLDTAGMDELRDYFVMWYLEARAEHV